LPLRPILLTLPTETFLTISLLMRLMTSTTVAACEIHVVWGPATFPPFRLYLFTTRSFLF
jgi:hypothetical protein